MGSKKGSEAYQMDYFYHGVNEEMNSAEKLEDFMQMVEEERSKNLEKYPEYQKLELEEQELLKMNPFIPQLIQGNKISRKMKPTPMQWHGLVDFLILNHKKRIYEEMQTLIIGYKACIGYFNMLQR